MTRLSVFHPFYRAAALALALVSLQPGLAAVAQRTHATPIHSAAPAAHSQMRGALLALHRAARSGDLGLGDGTLVPLRFASAAQQRRLRVGDRLVITAAGPARTRVPVRTLRVDGHTATVRVRGVVVRVLEHGNVELLGAHGAAVSIHFSSTHSRSAIVPGAEIDVDVRIAPAGTLLARRTRRLRVHVTHVEVTGTVRATNPAAGTITVEDEDGARTVVAVGPRARTYYVGQQADVSGSLSYGHGTTRVVAQDDGHRGGSNTAGGGRHDGGNACYYACPAASPTAQSGRSGGSGDDRHGGNTSGCYYTCPPTTTAGASATPAPSGDDRHGGGSTGCYYTCPSGTPSATPAASGDDNHSGGSAGCYYTCPPTPTGVAQPSPTASGDDNHSGGGTGCYYTCPPTPTAGTTAPSTTPTPSGGDDNGSGGGTGCYYTCPATPTSAAGGQASPTATASSDDNGSGGGVGCYYTCPATPTSTGTAVIAPPTATATDDEHQRGKPTPTPSS